ncbi:2-hydroxyacyl-CoA dehydratase [Nocardia sp. CA-290969]|uniref:2-hydroxyacyl-CoA dehydratase n=1 Tax=Nocardia sp. CA-290969 TaxID=3239986 RepID=UPI003D89BD48
MNVAERVRELHDSSVDRAAAGLGIAGEPADPRPVAGVVAGESEPARAGSGRPVIGVVGGDVPVEIIEACGGRAFRLSAAEREAGVEAVELLGAAVDSVFHSILDRILTGEFGFLRALVVSRDCQGSLRLFYVLRMLARQGRTVPEVHLVDLLHLSRESTRDYNARQIAALAEVVAGWTGTALTEATLYKARESRGQLAGALRDLRAQRVAGAVPGATALRLYALAQTEAPADSIALIDAVLESARPAAPREPDLHSATRGTADSAGSAGRRAGAVGPSESPAEGKPRVFLTGSTVDQVAVYEKLEAAGVLIVGEDHNWGDPVADLWAAPAAATEPAATYTAIAEHRLRLGPMAQTSGLSDRARFSAACARRCAAEVVLSIGRHNDPAPGWDRPGLIRELGSDLRVAALSVAAHTWSADELGAAVALLIREDCEATAR